jgi:glycosyltransferase involved in cell wall biosynthesis
MNITIVCGHYLPKLGYIEVHLARAFVRGGHRVAVVTTTAVPAYVARHQGGLPSGVFDEDGIKVYRLKPFFSLGQIVVARGVEKAVRDTAPDLVVVIGLGKRFPKHVFDKGFKIVTLFGDNEFSYAESTAFSKLKTQFLFRIFKRSTYQKAIDSSAHLVAYTPQSFDAAARMLAGRFAEKLRNQHQFISLGFREDDFFFAESLRESKRSELGLLPNQKVVVTATRVVPEKHLEEAIDLIERLPDGWVWLVVGSDGGLYAKSFEQQALKALGPVRFRILSYQDRTALNALYNAADIALYTVPAISIFEALGTGLPCILPLKKSLKHIIQSGKTGFYYDQLHGNETIEKILQQNLSISSRVERVETARAHFSWKAIASALLDNTHLGSGDS